MAPVTDWELDPAVAFLDHGSHRAVPPHIDAMERRIAALRTF